MELHNTKESTNYWSTCRSVPIVRECTSGKRANQRKGNKNMRELLNDAQKKLRTKMKNRESATRSRERKKVWCNILIVTLYGMLSLWDYLYGEQSMVVQASNLYEFQYKISLTLIFQCLRHMLNNLKSISKSWKVNLSVYVNISFHLSINH